MLQWTNYHRLAQVQAIGPDDDIDKAARIMSENQIRRLAVIEDGDFVGIVSIGDLAVKNDDEQVAGQALAEVSEGVKQKGRNRRGSSSAQPKQRGSRQQKAEGRMQLISNRGPRQEQRRQARVSPARSQKRSARSRKAS